MPAAVTGLLLASESSSGVPSWAGGVCAVNVAGYGLPVSWTICSISLRARAVSSPYFAKSPCCSAACARLNAASACRASSATLPEIGDGVAVGVPGPGRWCWTGARRRRRRWRRTARRRQRRLRLAEHDRQAALQRRLHGDAVAVHDDDALQLRQLAALRLQVDRLDEEVAAGRSGSSAGCRGSRCEPDWFQRLNCAEIAGSWSMRDSTCRGPKTSASVGKRKRQQLAVVRAVGARRHPGDRVGAARRRQRQDQRELLRRSRRGCA